jgi:DNA-binding XRE family transcriptional regulator
MTTATLVRPAGFRPNPAAVLPPLPAPARPPIGTVIRQLRRRRGLSQVTCAQLMGYSETWLSQVERGVRTVDSITALRELARVLDVDVRKLIEVVL